MWSYCAVEEVEVVEGGTLERNHEKKAKDCGVC